MEITNFGSGRALINGDFRNITWKPNPHCDYHIDVTDDQGNTYTVSDYDDRCDVMYISSDDGHIFYNNIVVLNPGEADGDVPDQTKLNDALATNAAPIMESVVRQETDPDDLIFAMNILRSPIWMYRWVEKHKTIEAAARAVRKQVFRVS